MKHVLTYVLVCTLATAVAGEVRADEKTRFESTGFLQSLDLFITNQINKLRSDNRVPKTDTAKDLKLSLRDASEEKQTGFLYLKDKSSNQSDDTIALSERPDFSTLMSPDGTFGSGRALYGAQSRLGFKLGGGKDGQDKGLLIELESGYRLSQNDLLATNRFSDVTSDLNDTEINFGLLVGYGNFNVDASVYRTNSIIGGNSLGYDIGLSYARKNWSARLSMSEYKQGADLLGIENEARNIISVELGARYRLSDRLGLQGGVRVYDYTQRMMINPGDGEFSQMIFLGGHFTF